MEGSGLRGAEDDVEVLLRCEAVAGEGGWRVGRWLRLLVRLGRCGVRAEAGAVVQGGAFHSCSEL